MVIKEAIEKSRQFYCTKKNISLFGCININFVGFWTVTYYFSSNEKIIYMNKDINKYFQWSLVDSLSNLFNYIKYKFEYRKKNSIKETHLNLYFKLCKQQSLFNYSLNQYFYKTFQDNFTLNLDFSSTKIRPFFSEPKDSEQE